MPTDDEIRWGWDEQPDNDIDFEMPEDAPQNAPQMQVPPPPRNQRTLHFAFEALEPQPPIEWVVGELFSAGSLSLVVGEPGCKKTWSMLDLSACVAIGEPWLQFATQKAPVLIIDEESGNRRLMRRLGDVLRGHDCDTATPLFYTTLAGFDLGKKVDADQIQDLIFMTGAKFVLIDALVDVMLGRDENAAQFVQPIFHALRVVADNTQAAIVVIHHSAKAGGYRGSSAIKGAVDQMLMVESDPEKDLVTFKSDKARDTKHAGFSADAHFEPDRFFMTCSSAPVGRGKLKPSEEFVIRYLDLHTIGTIKEMQSAADVCSPDAARKAIYKLQEPGLEYVKRTNPGTTGSVAVYGLTQKGREYADKMP